MGKEWLNWGKSGMKKRSKDEESEESVAPGCMCAVFQLFNFHYYPFALHHHQPSVQPTTTTTTRTAAFFQNHQPIVLKGVEAPRNSLELMEPLMEVASSSSTQVTDKYLNIQMGMQMRTKDSNSSNAKPKIDQDFSSSLSENSNSPSIKTPNLVARLMGLDLLPQTTSPKLEKILKNPSCKKEIITTWLDKNAVSGTVSLPETPRISASGRSDVENRRLSLQLDEIPAFTIKTEKCKRQILKQVKEKVGRTFGLDVTNSIKCGSDSNLVNHISSLMKYESGFSGQILNLPRKEPELEPESEPEPSVTYSLSKEDKRETEQHNDSAKTNVQVQLNQKPKKSVGSCDRVRKPPQACDDGVRSKKEEPMATNKGIIVFDKKVKKTPLSSDHVNISFPANQQLDKPGPNHSSSQALHHSTYIIKQTKQKPSSNNTSSSSTNLYCNHQKVVPTFQRFQENRQPNCTLSFIHGSKELNQYIQWILKRTGIEKDDGHVSLNKWYSINHPLDPSLFHYLELFHSTTGTLRPGSRVGGGEGEIVCGAICTTRFQPGMKMCDTDCPASDVFTYGDMHVCGENTCRTFRTACIDPNRKMYGEDCSMCVVCTCTTHGRCQRKLIFDLVDELLADILVNPFMSLRRPWIVNVDEKMNGSDLVDMLCERIGCLQSVKCEVREDIDALIYDDLRRVKAGNKRHGFEAEEEEGMVMYIADCIVRELVHETTIAVLFDVAKRRYDHNE